MRRSRRNNVIRRAGFSLLELLTVLIIIGVLAGAVVLSYTGATETRTLHTHAERFMFTVELARQQSTLTNEIWGVRLRSESYEFMRILDDGEWHVVAESPFQFKSVGADYDIRSRLLGKSQSARSFASQKFVPDIAIYPSGEISPFEMTLTHLITQNERYVISDGIQRAVVSDEPYRPVTKADES